MILLAKLIWCFYLVLIQCCSGLELLSQEEVIAQVSLELILLMPSSHQRAISSLLANGWKLSGFLYRSASLKIGRGQPWGQLQLHFMGTLEAHVLVCRGLGEKSLRSGVMLVLGQKKTLGQDLNFIRTRQGPKITGNLKKYCQQPWRYAGHMHSRNPYSLPTAELHGDVYQWDHTPFCGLIRVKNEPNFLVLFQHHNHNTHTQGIGKI